ncbi:MAG: ADP-ribosylation factor-like protein [Candidatus Thorarchaeota archaeon]
MNNLLPVTRIAFLGNPNTGKSSIGLILSNNTLPSFHIPTPGVQIYSSIISNPLLKRNPTKIIIFDLGGLEQLKHYKKYFFDSIDIICLFFAMNDPLSLDNLKSKWFQEIKESKDWFLKFEPRISLIGTKGSIKSSISSTKIENIAQSVNAYKINVISNTDPKNLNDLFTELINDYYQYKEDKYKVPDDFSDIF